MLQAIKLDTQQARAAGRMLMLGVRYTLMWPQAGAGGVKYFSVIALGQRINSDWSETVAVHTYSNPTAPTAISLSPTTVFTGDPTTLSWSGANAGVGVGIQKYQYLLDGVWEEGGTGSSTTITAPTTAGTYTIKVRAVGDVSGYNSAESTATATLTVENPNSTGTLSEFNGCDEWDIYNRNHNHSCKKHIQAQRFFGIQLIQC